ncbi:MBL fold metallo-hydrolase [Zavarzinia sp. CC-PAN008]|uniref:MBL fold metallo-hydrolase n=1 Tax=Zavarzinia sp. CC-PAN008 TaxID=3243332 RepID=UPI003F743B8B
MSLPVAPTWFQRRAVAPGLTLFSEPHVHSWFRANIWHIAGRDLDLLVDTGMGIASLKQALGPLADRPILAIASHGHVDHTGGHFEFDQRAIHPAEATALEAVPERTLADYFPAKEAAVTALPHADWDLRAYTYKAAPATRLLHEGDVIDLGGRRLTVLHLPGHSPGSIGLFDEHEGVLFSGDAIYEGELLDDLPFSDGSIYEATMRRLIELGPRMVHGGHGPSFDRARLAAIAQDYLNGRRRQGCPVEAGQGAGP